MAAYSYQAIDQNGKVVKGLLEGDSSKQIRSLLREKNLKPIDVTAAKVKRQKERQARGRWFGPKVKAADLSLLTRQLSILVQSNVPLDESLAATAKNAKKPNVQSLLLEVRGRVVEGYSLTKALGSIPTVFDSLYVAMVNAGERSGFLGPVLERLADYTEKREDMKRSVKGALAYPAFLLLFSIAVVVGLIVFIIPKLVKTFSSAGIELPLLTKGLIAISHFLISYGWLIILIVAALFYIFKRWLKKPSAHYKWSQFLLNLPILGELFRKADTARFASTLSVLMSSGVPLLEGLRISSQVLSNDVLKQAAVEAATVVQEGGSLRKALSNSEQFPVMMVQMVGSGEVSGELEQMLSRAASNQERELNTTVQSALSVLGPMIVVIMGGLVALIVMSVLLPIFEMSNIAA